MQKRFKPAFPVLLAIFLAASLLPPYPAAGAQWTGTITIRPDGSVVPANAPILRRGNTYTLTRDISAGDWAVIVQRPGIVLDGGGHTLHGRKGVLVEDAWHVTVRNLRTSQASVSVKLDNASYAVIGNNSFYSYIGVYVFDSHHVSVEHNSFTLGGIILYFSPRFSSRPYNVVRDNTVNGKPLVYLEGENGKTVSGEAGQLVIIYSTNIEARDLRVSETSFAVFISNSYSINVSQGRFLGNKHAVSIASSKKISIVDNYFRSTYAVDAVISSALEIRGNDAGDDLVFLNDVRGSIVEGNVFHGGGVELHYSSNNVLRNNTVNGKPILYLEGEEGETVSGVLGQLILANSRNLKVVDVEISGLKTAPAIQVLGCEDIVVEGARLQKVYRGIVVEGSSRVVIRDSVLEDIGLNGVELRYSRGNRVEDSSITRAIRALYLVSADNNVVTGNVIASSKVGIHLSRSNGNLIALNQIRDNEVQASTVRSSANRWDNGTHGNFWSDYKGWDADGDGIGDKPYVIDTGNVDRHPLVRPYASYVEIAVASPYGEASGSGRYKRGQMVELTVTPSLLDLGNGTRRVFEGWYIGADKVSSDASYSFPAEKPVKVEARWRTEYRVEVYSRLGRASGTGWYPRGSQAVAAVEPTEIKGLLQSQVFTGWSLNGKIVSREPTYSFTVNGPVRLEAQWRRVPNTANIAALTAAAVLAVIAVIAVIALRARASRERPPRRPAGTPGN